MSVKSQTKKYFYSALTINLISIIIPFVLKNYLPPLVPLFYQRPIGEWQLVPVLGLAIAPTISFVITITNIVISSITKDDFLKKVLAIAALVISILTAITIIKIVFLVGFF